MKRKRKRIRHHRRWDRFQVGEDSEAEAAMPGWVGVFFNNLYQVSWREIGEEHKVDWLCIRRRDSEAIHDWRDLQRIKNELCGTDREAVEIYPAEDRLVDTSNNYHLWVLPRGFRVPFGYDERDVSDRPFGANKQRPFETPPEDLNAQDFDPDNPFARTIKIKSG